MLPVAAALLAWGVTGAAAARTAPPETAGAATAPAVAPAAGAPSPAGAPPASGGPPGGSPSVVTTLDFPRPHALPCRRFETLEVALGNDADSVSDGVGTTLSWSGGGREWSVFTFTYQPLPEPLTPFQLPTRAQLTTPFPVGASRVTFFCRRYDINTPEGQYGHDAGPFIGVRWSCTGGRCVPEVGYALPKNLAVSPGRLRLCAKESEKDWKEKHPGARPCRDATPAFQDRDKALALAGELLADARRTLTDACRVPDACSSQSRTVMAMLRPARWRPTTFSGTPAGLRLTAETDDRKLDLDCLSRRDGGVRCVLTLHDGAGRELLSYAPLASFGEPKATLNLAGQGHVHLTAASDDHHQKPDGAGAVSGELLDVR